MILPLSKSDIPFPVVTLILAISPLSLVNIFYFILPFPFINTITIFGCLNQLTKITDHLKCNTFVSFPQLKHIWE